ncbi:hypothetical protein AB3Y13_08815 [Vibrio alginolyticus]
MHTLALFKQYSTEKCFPGKALKFQTKSTTFSIHLNTYPSDGSSMGDPKSRHGQLSALLNEEKL